MVFKCTIFLRTASSSTKLHHKNNNSLEKQAMAQYLASIYGTEKDKVNCSFYYKTGACRHGDKCSRLHTMPTYSQTILLKNFYISQTNAATITGLSAEKEVANPNQDKQEFEEFYEEVFREVSEKYGRIEEMHVCENLGDHLLGNVYITFETEESAGKAVEGLNQRWFNGRPVYADLSPVTDYKEASCSQHKTLECTRAGFCNFMHIKPVSRDLKRTLFNEQGKESGPRRRSRTRSPRGRYEGHRRRRSRSRERYSRR